MGVSLITRWLEIKEIAMKTHVVQVGLDVHRTFSNLTERDALGKVIGRGRLDHRDRTRLRERLGEWPEGTPVVLESTFGWGWTVLSLEINVDQKNHETVNARTKPVKSTSKFRSCLPDESVGRFISILLCAI